MAIILNNATDPGPSLKTETIGIDECELIKIGTGSVGNFNPVSDAFPWPVSDANASLTVDTDDGPLDVQGEVSFNDGGNRQTVVTGPGIKLIHDGITALAVEHLLFDQNTSAAHVVKGATTDKVFVMTHLVLVADGDVKIRFVTNTATPVPTSGWLSLAKNVGMVLPFSPQGWSESGSGLDWGIQLDAAVQVGGTVYGAVITP